MTNYERQEQYLNELYEVAERRRHDIEWVLEVENVTGKEVDGVYEDDNGNFQLGEGAVEEAEKYLAWEIAETAMWIETYAETEREYASYRHMVEIESRSW